MVIFRSIHLAANGIISFFLELSNIPLYVCITSSLSIHSSVVGHLGYFPVLAIVNTAAMNAVVCVSFQIRMRSYFYIHD